MAVLKKPAGAKATASKSSAPAPESAGDGDADATVKLTISVKRRMPDGSEVFIAPGMERRCSDADREAVRAAMTEEVQGWVTELLELYPDTDPIEDSEGDAEEGEADEIDLDALDDDSVSALCEHLGLKGKTIKAKRAALAEVDPGELGAAIAELSGDGEDEAEFDLDEVVQDEEVLAALCEHFDIKAKTAKLKIAALKKLDADEVAAAYAEMTEGDGEGDGEEGEGEDVDIDTLDDDEINALAEHFKIKGKTKALKLAALRKLDIADVTAAYVELTGEGDGEEGEGEEGDGEDEGGYTEAELKALQLEELQAIAEEWELPAPKLAKTAKLAEKKTAYIKAILKAQDAE